MAAAAVELILDRADTLLVLGEDLLLLLRDHDVVLRDRDARLRGVVEAEVLDRVEDRAEGQRAVPIGEPGDEIAHLLLAERRVHELVRRWVEPVPERLRE